ncbi:MAG: hypothetical protein J6O61_09620 [Butyrivibrio sp.]|uniref:hypothetical protein n=1 Tax=Butyrivibrio sp. TaxID=28121 RepID=UPI001AFE2F28|nr:hypothetical protein [Butyrivibrio sp.]MBO6241067.1 hypothetical protein [Butyrivibrio sp.]
MILEEINIMHESTNISYGTGTVTINANSDSLTEVAAPTIRVGDYDELIISCLTKKELNDVFDGAPCEITFNYVMLDEAPSAQVKAKFDEFIAGDTSLSSFSKGFYMDVTAQKTIDSDVSIDIYNLNNAIELQIEIPLFLRKDGRSFACIANNMGVCEVLEDADEEADTLSVSADCVGSYLLLYKDSSISPEHNNTTHRPTQYIFILGIIALLALWFAIDKLHKQNK